MNENQKQDNQNKALFVNMVSMLTISTMQQLGKVINPATGKTAVNMEAAQATIDMLDMLEAKTRGNLDQDEEKMLKEALTSLKINYVETRKTAEKQTDGTAQKTPESGNKQENQPPPEQSNKNEQAQTTEQTQKGQQDTSASEAEKVKKDPKFHKSYS